MAFVYVLFSDSTGRTYAGCSADWTLRLNQHNAGRVKATRRGSPWRVVHLENVEAMIEARRRELYLKTSAGRRWLRSVLGDLRAGTLARPAQSAGRGLAPDSSGAGKACVR